MSERARAVRAFVIAAACLATFVVAHAATSVPVAPPRLDALPMAIGGWSAVDAPPLDAESARILAADQYVHRFYQGPAGSIEMDVAYYSQPRVGANMHSPLNCLPGNGWTVSSMRSMTVAGAAGSWDMQSLVVERGQTRYAMAYWFQTRQRVLSGELSTRLSLLGDALRRHPTDAGIVRLMMPMTGSAAGGPEDATLAAFASQFIPQLSASLR